MSAVREDSEVVIVKGALDAAARGIADGRYVRVFNERGSLELRARITDRARPGVVVALSVWWKKLTRDGKNANELTAALLTWACHSSIAIVLLIGTFEASHIVEPTGALALVLGANLGGA
jgi:anaerobic selenocysteine-containing dehydrogenase